MAVSCYEDYITDFNYTGVYFPYQVDVRTFVVGEGMKIEIGVALGGVRENDRDRFVSFMVDNSLINAEMLYRFKNLSSDYIRDASSNVTALSLIPANYYNISDADNMIIKSREHSGYVVLRPDSASFLADPGTLTARYVLPLRITSADADSVIKKKNYSVVGLKYENMLFGNYWHGGVTIVKDAGGNTVNTINYFTSIPMVESKIWKLKTSGPMTLVTNGYSNQTSTVKNEVSLTLNSGTITVASAPGSTFTIQPDGESTFNQAILLQNRKIFLKYKYTDPASNLTYYCTDTLAFRNRIRDGVNEWQDENPSHYGK